MGGMDSNLIYVVPWKVLAEDPPAQKDGLVLYWLTADRFDTSLKYSRVLTLFAARCVSMYAPPATTAVAQKLSADLKLPAVVLTGPDGTVLGKADSAAGKLTFQAAERLVDDEVKKRDEQLKDKIGSANDKAKAGDKDAAIAQYREVADEKCLFPKRAKEATKRLTKLGVGDVAEVFDAPNWSPAVGDEIEKTLKAGLKAEDDAKYDQALNLYEQAHRLDPADPVPLRYVGELYRHDIGDWKKAREIFEEILAEPADPLSRAVALHGLGKMTIHEGSFKKGEQLIEKSVEAYPLAMAYRNLAVYWNSEGDPAKADYYTHEAIKAAPKDPFNLVFAAALMAGNGHKEEALKIAIDNEGLLPASYNLAAIYAQNGQKEKALQLLKRHFYEYERNKSVRGKEMMEARVDRVFASLIHDKDFLALTSAADGMLEMRGSAATGSESNGMGGMKQKAE